MRPGFASRNTGIRLLEKPCSAKEWKLEVRRDGGELQGVDVRLYLVAPDVVRTVLDATGDDRETETVLKMFPEKTSALKSAKGEK